MRLLMRKAPVLKSQVQQLFLLTPFISSHTVSFDTEEDVKG